MKRNKQSLGRLINGRYTSEKLTQQIAMLSSKRLIEKELAAEESVL